MYHIYRQLTIFQHGDGYTFVLLHHACLRQLLLFIDIEYALVASACGFGVFQTFPRLSYVRLHSPN